MAAAILARSGWSVTVLERSPVAGGAVRSEALTTPGYVHDTYSAFYGLLHASPVLAELGLDRTVAWARHALPVAAAVGPSRVALCHTDAESTAEGLGIDGGAWRELWAWWLRLGSRFLDVMLAPLPALGPAARFLAAGRVAGTFDAAKTLLEPMEAVAAGRFATAEARALLASGVTHTDLGVDLAGSTPFALVLAMVAQQHGMPVPIGGAGRLAEALVASVERAGGQVLTGCDVTRVVVERGRAVGVETAAGGAFRARRAVLADTGPTRLFAGLVGEAHVPTAFLAGLRRFRYGTGVFKVDIALRGAPAWTAPGLAGAGVVHLTGDLDSMARSSFEARRGALPAEPLLIVGQQSVADPSRAPEGGHTLWVETHVPSRPRAGAWADVEPRFLDAVLDRLEAHAPGLREQIVGLAVRTPVRLEAENPNLVGGDLGGGSNALDQLLVFRPVPGWFRYSTPVKSLYLCSASAHPGGGVHGMVGRNCARRVLVDARLGRSGRR